MKKAIIALLCIAVLGGGGYFGWKAYERKRDESKVVSVVPVRNMAMSTQYWYNSNELYGGIEAANSQRVYVDTQKLVQSVNVTQGQRVRKGDVILEYDMTVVELELAQKENRVREIEQDIVMQKKELERLKTLRPAEERPASPTYEMPEDLPDEPEYPEYPEPHYEPLHTLPEIGAGVQPVSGTGTAEDPLLFLCNTRSVVRKSFLMMLAGAGTDTHVSLCVFDDNDTFLYQWRLSASKIDTAKAEEWRVTDGLIFDEETGEVLVDPEGELKAQLSLSEPDLSALYPDEPELPEEPEEPEEPEPVPEMPEEPDYGENYQHTRSELQSMIIAQEGAVKRQEIALKTAQLALETAKKQKTDGKVVAEMDGIVKKIGSISGEEPEEEPEDTEEDLMAEEGDAEYDDGAFAVIEGEGGVELVCDADEFSFGKMPVGTKMRVMSFMNGAETTGTVLGYDEEPTNYGGPASYYDNPNVSRYRMHIGLDDPTDFRLYSGAQATLLDEGDAGSGLVNFIPIYYLREEDGAYYAMAADENDRLVKKPVIVGSVEQGMVEMIEIRGGLDIEHDRICFPYGTDVREGVKTKNTAEVLMPSNMW